MLAHSFILFFLLILTPISSIGKMEGTPVTHRTDESQSHKKTRRRQIERDAARSILSSRKVMGVDDAVGPSNEASSSKLVETPSKAGSSSKRSKGKGKQEQHLLSLATPTPGKQSKKEANALDEASSRKPGAQGSAGWACVPIAKGGVSRIPHVWSRDGR
jgi:hypothetical protein